MNLDLMHVTFMILSKVDSNFLFMTDLDMDYSTLGDRCRKLFNASIIVVLSK